ncbi:MAG TPA: hypothetical protein VMS60_16095 [Solirubrobacterales bacterium]|nr:hypothetical protein [Solirubrobacterales bacterium]
MIALIVALTGTAFAAGAFTKKQTKQVAKLARKAFDSRIGGASVKRSKTAGSAETTARAIEAGKATEAAKVREALRANVAAQVPEATRADEATKVPVAERATQVPRADEATRAATAGNVGQLGGKPVGEFQGRVDGTCPPPQSISSVQANGTVICTSPVQAVRSELGVGASRDLDLGNGLRLNVGCTTSASTLNFTNVNQPNVNFSLLQTDNVGPAVFGKNSGPGLVVAISTTNRTAYHVVWVTATAVTTLRLDNFHASNGANPCRLTGVAMTALG